MPIINYITDENTVSRLTNNKSWLGTYIPEVTKKLEKKGFEIVFDSEEHFDLMHIHMPLYRAYRLINDSNCHNVPIIYHGNATEDTFSVGRGTKHLVRKWFKKMAGYSDLIICPSRSAEEYYRELLPDHAIMQLNYGIKLDKYVYSDEAREAFRQQYGIVEDEVVITCVGGLSVRKGIKEFINISRRHPELRFMWVGGEYTQHPGIDLFYSMFAREGDVRAEDVTDNILLTGYTPDVPGALSASDIFFFPSRQETQGLALVEAAACGLPVVTRDLPVFREWLSPGHNCLMGSTEQEFEEEIEQLVSDTDLRKRLGNEGRKSAEAHHDIEKTASRLGEVYKELLSL
ncbi:MAG: glycosyltransferase family 4 protein [Methanosarcinales archaeon]|nr:glycosyltransferase family 4 protein [Methanosarcinales archaeon]